MSCLKGDRINLKYKGFLSSLAKDHFANLNTTDKTVSNLIWNSFCGDTEQLNPDDDCS